MKKFLLTFFAILTLVAVRVSVLVLTAVVFLAAVGIHLTLNAMFGVTFIGMVFILADRAAKALLRLVFTPKQTPPETEDDDDDQRDSEGDD